MRFDFHPKLGERSAGNDSNFSTNTRLDQARAVNHRVQRASAEGFRIRTGSVVAAALFGNGLTKIPTTAIVTVADRFFRATYDKVDFFRTQLESIQQGAKRMSRGNLSREIFQQDIGSKTGVFSMTWLEGAHQSLTGV